MYLLGSHIGGVVSSNESHDRRSSFNDSPVQRQLQGARGVPETAVAVAGVGRALPAGEGAR